MIKHCPVCHEAMTEEDCGLYYCPKCDEEYVEINGELEKTQ